jgi:hypothetical protein
MACFFGRTFSRPIPARPRLETSVLVPFTHLKPLSHATQQPHRGPLHAASTAPQGGLESPQPLPHSVLGVVPHLQESGQIHM